MVGMASSSSSFDAVNGYFQIALDEESSMLTTFLLPSGRYRYLRIPQGLNASSDEWCRRSDAVVDGLLWAKKIVDDILIWATSLQELQQRIEIIAQNCERLNVILSKKKFSIGTSMPFAGYIVSNKGVHPDPTRVESISNFPRPKDLTALKSFLGMAQQLAFFIPDYAHATVSMRSLLGKGKTFLWLDDQEFEFKTLKTLLTKNMQTNHFDSTREVYLLTDAS